MAWLRVGDNIATHPLMSRLTEACKYDHALKNEVFGLFIALASVSACHLTDYVVEPGLVGQFAPGRERVLMDVLRSAGLVENVRTVEADRVRWLYKLTNDPDFVHMRSKKEVEIDRSRKRDSRNPQLQIPVRVRDGDQCRFCGKTVNFADHRSARGGTIDSLNHHQDSTVDDLVVACRACNAGREQNPDGYELRPAPADPWYSPATVRWINTHKWSIANGIHVEGDQSELPVVVGEGSKLVGLDDPIESAPEWAKPIQEQAAAVRHPAAGPADLAAGPD
uniref:HNH endonuclease n=1 Tax=Corynebacterium pyruviciproducens TaxID=598660 RepID=UPI003C6C9B6B